MLRNLLPRNSEYLPLLLVVILTPVMAAVGWLVTSYGALALDRLIDKASSSAGGVFNLVIIAIASALSPLLFFFVLRGRLVTVLSFYIACLPAIYRFRGFWAIAIKPNDYQDPELISASTFLAFLLLAVFIARGNKLRKSGKFYRSVEILLWGYVLLGTLSQFVNLDIWSAFWLSFKGLWQYLAWFYLVSGAVNDRNDVDRILKAIVLSIVVGIVFRQGTHGVGFVFERAGSLVRVDGGAFGPAVSYGGYLAFASVIGLYLARSSHKWSRVVWWLLVTALILFELINTHTRGAILSLFLIPVLLFFPNERKFLLLTILVGALALILSGVVPEIVTLASQRNLSLSASLLDDYSVQTRFELWRLSIPHVFDGFGFGYGIGNALNVSLPGRPPLPSHNLVLELTQYVGAYATLCFVALYVGTLIMAGLHANGSSQFAFSFVALLIWLVFANTTATSILYYYPSEATILMFTMLFLTQLSLAGSRRKNQAFVPASIEPGSGFAVTVHTKNED